MIDFYPEGWLIDTIGNRLSMQNPATLAQASHDEKILEARALVCDGEHNLVVDLGCMKGIISREDGAIGIKEGLVRDIAVISRVNRPVCFTITGFKKDQNGHTYATLSRKNAQIKCMNQYIKVCKIGDVINILWNSNKNYIIWSICRYRLWNSFAFADRYDFNFKNRAPKREIFGWNGYKSGNQVY